MRCASHEHVVDMIRSSGSLVTMTVVSQTFPNNFQQQIAAQQQFIHGGRQCATLPRKMASGTRPAPMPPRRDPKTTLSVGRARAKSMVAGLEGGSTDKDDDDLPPTTKSSSAESIHQQSLSSASTPTQGGPGTPIQLRTASIKARPTSGRITAAELEELFQRQQGESNGEHRYSTMMSSSRFQSGTDSGTATPPASPQRGPIVYASVAEMKRKKNNKMGTLRGKPCAIPIVSSDLKRTFHSTPDLASGLSTSTASIWLNGNNFKGHRSQDDMQSLHASIQRLNLPPPNHPPPPPPVGQVVKVDVSRGSEYESTVKLQNQLQMQDNKGNSNANKMDDGSEIRSSFKPANHAKLYASPQDLMRNVAFRANDTAQTQSIPAPPPPAIANEQHANSMVRSFNHSNVKTELNCPIVYLLHTQIRLNSASSLRTSTHSMPSTISYAGAHPQRKINQYAQPIRAGTLPHPTSNRTPLPQLNAQIPQIPEPDYSLSESDGEDENSVLLAHNTKMNEHIAVPAETSGNSNAR